MRVREATHHWSVPELVPDGAGVRRMTSRLPRVSVVVPTFNAGPAILETLDGVIGQTLHDVEIILVDDASTDGTPDLVRRERPGVTVIEQDNGGCSRARNRGLSEARAPFVCFLDQDDVWHPFQLQRQLDCLQANPLAAAVATPYWFWFADADGVHRWPPWPPDPGLAQLVHGYEGWTYHLFLKDCWALTSATMLRVGSLRDAGGFDESLEFAEDWELWLRLSRQHPFLQLTWPPVRYRQHPVQGSRRVRSHDFRSDLLETTARRHGLCSPDGQCLDGKAFRRQLARYRMEFGYHHLVHGDRALGIRSLLKAWWLQPGQLRWGGLAMAAALGWRPRQSANL